MEEGRKGNKRGNDERKDEVCYLEKRKINGEGGVQEETKFNVKKIDE